MTTPTTLATIKGAASTDGLSVSGKKITLEKSALNSKVTIGGSYDFNFASKYKTATITGSKNADIITTNGTKLSVNAGKGNDTIKVNGSTTTVKGGDGADVFIFKKDKSGVIADYAEEDKIQFISGTAEVTTSGDNVIFTVGKGKITLTNAADKTVSYVDDGGEQIYSSESEEPITFNDNNKKTAVTLLSSYAEESFKASDYSSLVTINASAVTKGIELIGNAKANKIIGGSGNDTIDGDKNDDTLTGGKGSDVFIYYDGLGDDVITDYAEEDKISIASGEISNVAKSGTKDVVFTVGTGTIKVKNALNVGITCIDDFEHNYIKGKSVVDVNDENVTVKKGYWKDSFDVSKYGDDIKKIDAQKVNRDGFTIIGNAENNIINVGNYDCTLNGGRGNDVLYGGNGKNVYLYEAGDGFDSIMAYGANDIVSITSGRVENVKVGENSDTVILTVGEGKISLGGAANGNSAVIWYDDDGRHSKMYEPNYATSNFFASEDDIFLDNSNAQLNSIIRYNATDYSLGEISESTSLVKENNLIAYSGEK